jgi:hypothetical protein
MRLLILMMAILCATAGPALATKLPNRGQCRQLTKQISVHAATMDRATATQNLLWARSLDQQMTRMLNRRHRLCPDIAERKAFEAAVRRYEQTKQFLWDAGKVAARFFTLGAF